MTGRQILGLVVVLFLVSAGVLFAFALLPKRSGAPKIQSGMQLSSSAFENGAMIPSRCTCDGDNRNPPLSINGIPEGTVTLALVVDDPDAPAGTFQHWLLWNIPPETTKIEEGTSPAGAVQGTNNRGQAAYTGPCPPSGTHRYFFRLTALNTRLGLDSSATRKDLDLSLEGHVLGTAELMGRYSRSR
jgi:Raf kinase inhibitor-like YbhB/YbcL family protein